MGAQCRTVGPNKFACRYIEKKALAGFCWPCQRWTATPRRRFKESASRSPPWRFERPCCSCETLSWRRSGTRPGQLRGGDARAPARSVAPGAQDAGRRPAQDDPRGDRRARAQGLNLRGPVRLFLDMTIFGSEFHSDPQYEWAGATLANRRAIPRSWSPGGCTSRRRVPVAGSRAEVRLPRWRVAPHPLSGPAEHRGGCPGHSRAGSGRARVSRKRRASSASSLCAHRSFAAPRTRKYGLPDCRAGCSWLASRSCSATATRPIRCIRGSHRPSQTKSSPPLPTRRCGNSRKAHCAAW